MDWEMLRALGDEERRELLRRTRRRRFARNEVLFHEGDPADSLHLVDRGRVSVRSTTPLGEVSTFAVVGPGTVLGELALMSPSHRRSATAAALEPTETLRLGQQDFEELRRAHPSVDQFLIETLIGHMQRLHERLLEALFVPAETRVLRRLVDLAHLYADGAPPGPVVVPLSQEVLASLAGTSRATANQALRAAEQAGSVAVGRARVEIVDLDALTRRLR
jgi:CRP-like cAMP-binding protein